MKKISGVYQIKNKINGKVYVGSSNDIYFRWWSHKHNAIKKQSNKCPKLYAALRKYGVDAFEWIILLECDVSELYEKEQQWLDENFLPSNYNVSKSATAPMRGRQFSEEHIRKLKKARAKRKFSSSTRAKMSASRQGKKHTTETIKKISGEGNSNSKYTWELIHSIRADYASGLSVADIMAKYNIPKTTSWNIVSNRTWKAV